VGSKVDLTAAMSDNEVVDEVTFVSINLRILKRQPMPAVEEVDTLLQQWKMYDHSQEQVWVLAFDSSNHLRKVTRVAQGSYGSVEVPIAAVMSAVNIVRCDRFWLVHNHPGGSEQPSPADIDLTTKVMNAANICGLRFEDHIILAPPDSSFSFRGNGMIRDADEVTAVAANEIVVNPVKVIAHRTDVRS
jgi:DNA repair protein RadC